MRTAWGQAGCGKKPVERLGRFRRSEVARKALASAEAHRQECLCHHLKAHGTDFFQSLLVCCGADELHASEGFRG